MLTSLESIASQATANVRSRLTSSVAQIRLDALFSSFRSGSAALEAINQRLPQIIGGISPGLTTPWLTPGKPELASECHAGNFVSQRLDTGEPRLTARWATHVTDADGKVSIAYYNNAGDNIRIAEPQRNVIRAFEFDERHNLVGSMRFPLGDGAALSLSTLHWLKALEVLERLLDRYLGC